jgi:hypothetical protein
LARIGDAAWFMPTAPIERVLFTVDLHPGGTLKLAEMHDKSLCILRNGELIGGLQWRPAQIDQAVIEYERMRHQLRNDAPTNVN